MDINTIPFTKHLGIEIKDEGVLSLEPLSHVENHVGSIHASAQFALAETQSGLFLQTLFPQYEEKVLPLLRNASVKYKHPAIKSIYAHAYVDDLAQEKFIEIFEKKGRASITVMVDVSDEDGTITLSGEFTWFIQRIEAER